MLIRLPVGGRWPLGCDSKIVDFGDFADGMGTALLSLSGGIEMKYKKVTEQGAIALSKKQNAEILEGLKLTVKEEDVVHIYRTICKLCMDDVIIQKVGATDGLIKSAKHDLVGLMEFKYKEDIRDRKTLCKLLIQVVYYLHYFQEKGEKLPKVLLIGDQDECFVMVSSALATYIDMKGVDWTISPSTAFSRNREMLDAMMVDPNIHPFIFTFDSKFDFTLIVDKLLDLNKNGPVKLVQITTKNVQRIFEYFVNHVLKQTLTTNEQVELFVNLLIDPDTYCLHPKKNFILNGKSEIKCDRNEFNSFFSHFNPNCTRAEKDNIVRICDQLLEDETRRRKGAFFTPTIWVDEAHNMIEEHLGKDWKRDYVVWDCAAGTGNLTADYKFKELYVSTIDKEEINIQISSGSNASANRFTYDFLGEEGIEITPPVLQEAFQNGKKVLFFINPPYATAKNGSTAVSDSKAGVAKNVIGDQMVRDGIGNGSQQLYAQFMYKIYKLQQKYRNQIAIAIFSKPTFLTGEHFIEFRKKFLPAFDYKYGMIFQASEFADVSAAWPISFTIWVSK